MIFSRQLRACIVFGFLSAGLLPDLIYTHGNHEQNQDQAQTHDSVQDFSGVQLTQDFLLNEGVAAADEKITAPAQSENNFDPKDIMNFAQGIDFAEMQKVLFKLLLDHQSELAEKRARLMKNLPEVLRDRILDTRAQYEGLVEQFNIADCLVTLCEKSRWALAERLEEPCVNLLSDLEKLHSALVTKSFNLLIQQGNAKDNPMAQMAFNPVVAQQQMEQVMGDKDVSEQVYSLEDLSLCINRLESVQVLLSKPAALSHVEQKLTENLRVMCVVLSAIVKKDMNKMAGACFEYLQPDFDYTLKMFADVQADIEKTLELLDKDPVDNYEKTKALRFIQKELRAQVETLKVFTRIKNCADFESSEHFFDFFKIIARAYDIGAGFLTLYKIDHKQDVGFCNILDWSFKASLSTWAFMRARSEIAKGFVLMPIACGNVSLASTSALGDIISPNMHVVLCNVMAASIGSLLFCSPTLFYKKMRSLIKVPVKILTAWTYYQCMQNKLFDNLWPADDLHLKNALIEGINECVKYFAENLTYAIRDHVDSGLLDNLENYSLGVIKPEISLLMLELLMPVVLFKHRPEFVKKIVNLEASNVFAQHKKDKYVENVTHLYPNLNAYSVYAERSVLVYLADSIGEHCGSRIAAKYKSQIGSAVMSGLGAVGSVAVALGIVDQAFLDGLSAEKDDLAEGIEEIMMLFKGAVNNILQHDSQVHNMIVKFLISSDYLSADEKDQALINKKMLYLVLSVFLNIKLLNNRDAATLVRTFNANKTNDYTSFIDQFAATVQGNIAGMIGGKISGAGMRYAVETLLERNGPLYPKVSSWIQNQGQQAIILPLRLENNAQSA
jgi:hypothetical protein